MKVSVSKSKNQTIYYLSKSVWVDGKSTTKTIEKIGSEDELLKVCGDLTPLEWAKQYAAKRSAEEKASKKDIMLKYSSSTLIKKESCRSVNVGYLFLKDIYYDLKIHDICAQIAEKYKFEFDLNQILSMLLFSRIIYPGSKRSSLELSKKFLEKPDCKLHHVYRALEILAKENDFFQSQLYKNSEMVLNRHKRVLYYDCTNYYFEIEEADDFRKYGHSKENRPNPIVQIGDKKEYKLSELDEVENYEKTFYKDRWINEDGLEQHLVVTFSFQYRDYMRKIRNRQLERAEKLVENPSSLNKKRPNDPKRFIRQNHCTSDGEIADKMIPSIDEDVATEEERYDGFYAVCTNLEDDVATIIGINQKRWQIEECFRIMKSEFQARPVYLSRKDRITAHFITCFTALILYRILEKKLGESYTAESIIRTLKEMNMLIAPGEGYIPEYTRTDLTDKLHDTFGFRTDYEIVSQREIKKILTATRK